MPWKFVLMMSAALLLTACTNSPLGKMQDHQPDPAKKGAPWPTCTPKDSPACVAQ